MSDEQPEESAQRKRPLLRNEIIAEALLDPSQRADMGLPTGDDQALPVVIELNLQHARGLPGAVSQLRAEWAATFGRLPLDVVAEIYCQAELTIVDVQRLVAQDLSTMDPAERAIYRIWPDFPVEPLIDRSCSTVKADAARRSYDAAGRGIVWAVIDSGIDEKHPHFEQHLTLRGDVENLHRDFTQRGDSQLGLALTDGFGHGTHVAGIIAGGLGPDVSPYRVTQQVQDPANPNLTIARDRHITDPTLLAGIAPYAKLGTPCSTTTEKAAR